MWTRLSRVGEQYRYQRADPANPSSDSSLFCQRVRWYRWFSGAMAWSLLAGMVLCTVLAYLHSDFPNWLQQRFPAAYDALRRRALQLRLRAGRVWRKIEELDFLIAGVTVIFSTTLGVVSTAVFHGVLLWSRWRQWQPALNPNACLTEGSEPDPPDTWGSWTMPVLLLLTVGAMAVAWAWSLVQRARDGRCGARLMCCCRLGRVSVAAATIAIQDWKALKGSSEHHLEHQYGTNIYFVDVQPQQQQRSAGSTQQWTVPRDMVHQLVVQGFAGRLPSLMLPDCAPTCLHKARQELQGPSLPSCVVLAFSLLICVLFLARDILRWDWVRQSAHFGVPTAPLSEQHLADEAAAFPRECGTYLRFAADRDVVTLSLFAPLSQPSTPTGCSTRCLAGLASALRRPLRPSAPQSLRDRNNSRIHNLNRPVWLNR